LRYHIIVIFFTISLAVNVNQDGSNVPYQLQINVCYIHNCVVLSITNHNTVTQLVPRTLLGRIILSRAIWFYQAADALK